MGLVAAMESRRFAKGAIECCGISGFGFNQNQMAGDRTRAERIRRANYGFVTQRTAEICQSEGPNLRISPRKGNAAPYQSRKLSPRSGHEFSASIRRSTGSYGPSCVLRR